MALCVVASLDLGPVGAQARGNELVQLQASSKIENSMVTTGSNTVGWAKHVEGCHEMLVEKLKLGDERRPLEDKPGWSQMSWPCSTGYARTDWCKMPHAVAILWSIQITKNKVDFDNCRPKSLLHVLFSGFDYGPNYNDTWGLAGLWRQ